MLVNKNEGPEVDVHANQLFTLSAEQGNIDALYQLGLMHLKSYLITHDPQPASRADMASEGLPRLHAPIQPTCS